MPNIETPKKGQLVRIANLTGRDNYRRGGQKHPTGVKAWPHDAFSAKQLAQLDADPMIDVSIIDAPKAVAEKA